MKDLKYALSWDTFIRVKNDVQGHQVVALITNKVDNNFVLSLARYLISADNTISFPQMHKCINTIQHYVHDHITDFEQVSGLVEYKPIVVQCSISRPPENLWFAFDENLWFSDVFRGWNETMR